MNPYFVIGALLAAMSLFGSGYALGTHHSDNACVAAQSTSKDRAQANADKESDRRDGIGAQREASREHIRIVYRTLKEKARETSISNCGLDADGLRVWNAANSGESAPMRGEPDYGLSGTAASAVWKVDGLVPQPHRGDGVVQPVPGSAP